MMRHEALDFVRRVGVIANNVGLMAGVGGMELAGQIVSVLYEHPELLDRFMSPEGGELFISGAFDAKNGALTYQSIGNGIVSPANLRAQRARDAAAASPKIDPLLPEEPAP